MQSNYNQKFSIDTKPIIANVMNLHLLFQPISLQIETKYKLFISKTKLLFERLWGIQKMFSFFATCSILFNIRFFKFFTKCIDIKSLRADL